MTIYVDSSALLKRYVDEPDSVVSEEILTGDDHLATGRHTVVEVRRNLARLLDEPELSLARRALADDLRSISLVELDQTTARRRPRSPSSPVSAPSTRYTSGRPNGSVRRRPSSPRSTSARVRSPGHSASPWWAAEGSGPHGEVP